MGIYPERDYNRRSGGLLIETTTTPGMKSVVVYQAVAEFEEITDCFCCSCGDYGSDAACRNHGFAAKRPCDIHNLPGSEWELTGDPDDMIGGMMPEPVSVARASHR